jgi:hypothetical protein
MKNRFLTLITLTACLASSLHAAESKRTAAHILANSDKYEGKEVTLDVSFLKPVKWKSPIPEIAFFFAVTIDRTNDIRAGKLLIAIPETETKKFSQKYGLVESKKEKNNPDTLRGVLVPAWAKGANGKGMKSKGIWVIDTSGRLQNLSKTVKLELPEDDN